MVFDLFVGFDEIISWLISRNGRTLSGTLLTRSTILFIHCSLSLESSSGVGLPPGSATTAALISQSSSLSWRRDGPMYARPSPCPHSGGLDFSCWWATVLGSSLTRVNDRFLDISWAHRHIAPWPENSRVMPSLLRKGVPRITL